MSTVSASNRFFQLDDIAINMFFPYLYVTAQLAVILALCVQGLLETLNPFLIHFMITYNNKFLSTNSAFRFFIIDFIPKIDSECRKFSG